MNKINILVLVIGLLTMAGCTTGPAPLFGTVEPARFHAIDYYHWISLASPDATTNERVRLEQQILMPGAEEALVQLAVLISKASSSPEEDARALALLGEFDQRAAVGPVDSEYQIFSKLWRETLQMRGEVRSMSASKATDLARIEELEKESAELRRQIEALKRIEQQLDRRTQIREEEQVDNTLLR